MSDRLHKILARAGVASRRKAEQLIREGRVTVNGELAEVGTSAEPARDVIKVDGRRIRIPSGRRYFLLNKPSGYVTTAADPQGRPTVFDLVPAGQRRGLIAVGRLDYGSEGLLVLTDDGELAQRVAHPRFGCTKTYQVKVKGRPSDDAIDKLRQGIVLEGQRTRPARIVPRTKVPGRRTGENSWWIVELGEGRTRQIREMFFRVGHPVQKLRRVAVGALSDRALPLGAVRTLSEAEIALLSRRRKGRSGS